MAGTRMDGKAVAALVRERVRMAAAELASQGTVPCLATILVGDDAASATYVRSKHAACKEAGIRTRDIKLGAGASQAELQGAISELNGDPAVHGILMQLPLPAGLDEFAAVSSIIPSKDVDGLTPYNAGLLSSGRAALVACTPQGIMEILDHYKVGLEGKDIVIINRSGLVGRPLASLMLARNATVTVCHSKTADLAGHCRRADVIVTAVGSGGFVLDAAMVGDGAVVIDVATVRRDGRLCGDADYDGIMQRASFATPVPGGVGPMTIAMLLKNTITAASLGRGHAGS